MNIYLYTSNFCSEFSKPGSHSDKPHLCINSAEGSEQETGSLYVLIVIDLVLIVIIQDGVCEPAGR